MTRINNEISMPKVDSHKVHSHKDPLKFKKIYKETNDKKKEERKPEEKEPIPVHLLFSKPESLEKKEAMFNLPEGPQPSINRSSAVQATGNAVSSVTLDQHMLDLFEKMASEMTMMTSSGITETTITLNAPDYASSLFYGAQIIISEYSTAPRAFNIQFRATSEAVAAFHRNVKDLMAAFEGSGYNFKVNRLETDFLEYRPDSFKRKEPVSSDEKEKHQ
ncbi:MAG TPA: hypothetical protein VLG49_03990 [Rhabdochlamydiaceae bacterium]|nr:hypothetical protein [Rhabdochlamydiaceae bacterium]